MMDFKLPELGEGVYEAELVSWLVKPGDAVKRGQNLMEVLTDKATMEVPSPFAGTVGDLRAEPGEQLKIGQVVLTYEPAGAGANNDRAPQPAAAAEPKEKVAAAPPPGVRVTAPPPGVKAAPSVRLMARKLGIDLARVHGSGPGGRVLIEDLSRRIR